jgi:DNA-binding MarR family transcriptional regulator
MGVTVSTTSRLVDRLVAAGLVRRVAAADGDGRKVGLALTRSGGARARALMRARERAIGQALEELSPAQTAQLGELADQVLAAAAREHPAPGRLCRYCDEQACDLSRCPVELAATERGAA